MTGQNKDKVDELEEKEAENGTVKQAAAQGSASKTIVKRNVLHFFITCC